MSWNNSMHKAKSNPYQLVVFDWDGTLMDSAARIVTCMQRAAKDSHLPVPTPAAARDVIGLGLGQAMDKVFPGINAAQIDQLVEAYRTHWLRDDIPPSALFAGAEDMLQTLTDAGYLLAVATGKSRRGLDKVMAETQLGRFFHSTRCADESFSKPNPQMLFEILTDLNTEAQHALVVGDSEYDVQMAVNAKVDAAGVAHGVHTPQRLHEQGVLTVFNHLDEIPDWLSNI